VYYKLKENIRVSYDPTCGIDVRANQAAQPPLPFVLGAEFAGRISEKSPIPKGCHYKAGGQSLATIWFSTDQVDKVFGFAQGSFAENLVSDWKNLLPIPKGLSFEHACVVPLYVTFTLTMLSGLISEHIRQAMKVCLGVEKQKLENGYWFMLVPGVLDWRLVKSLKLSDVK